MTQIQQSLPPGISLVSADDLKQWDMDIRVLDANPLYKDQIYRLRFLFGTNYPIGEYISSPGFFLAVHLTFLACNCCLSYSVGNESYEPLLCPSLKTKSLILPD